MQELTTSILTMPQREKSERIAIVGGGPAGLFMFKRLVEANKHNLTIHIFERKNQLGAGFPYSTDGAGDEHITNVSGNEIPKLEMSLEEWVRTAPDELLDHFQICRDTFNEYKVLPRLFFGKYLEDQFRLLIQKARSKEIDVQVHLNTIVKDVADNAVNNCVSVITNTDTSFEFDKLIVCSGHHWIFKHEGKVPGYFDSPYPPAKLHSVTNQHVAIRGSSLTAIDAIRTLSKNNGSFSKDKNGRLIFSLKEDMPNFKITMFSRNGLLPAVRFHLDDSHLSKDTVLSKDEINRNRAVNEGFLSLDYVFDTKFKAPVKEKQPWFYEQIKNMSIEDFVDKMMSMRENIEPFNLLEAEYIQAEKSIQRKETVYWKEMLAVLSFVMNYPAKYFSAEDMLRLQKVLMPLISVVIAFVPQGSVEGLLALHKAGVLNLIAAGDDSFIEPADEGAVYHFTDDNGKPQSVAFKTYIDCVGQPHLSWKDIPYKSLINEKIISKARVEFKDKKAGAKELKKKNENVVKDKNANYYLYVPGITINDNFQIVNEAGEVNKRIFMMAVPYMGGFNPDYSGLDFGEAASAKIIEKIFSPAKQV